MIFLPTQTKKKERGKSEADGARTRAEREEKRERMDREEERERARK